MAETLSWAGSISSFIRARTFGLAQSTSDSKSLAKTALARMLLFGMSMKVGCPALVCGVLILVASSAGAQDPTTPATGTAFDNSWVSKLPAVLDKPLHPIVSGVTPSGGIGVGAGYDFPAVGNWQTKTKAVVTIRKYWSAEVDTLYRRNGTRIRAYTRMREMTQLAFFGPGANSEVANRTNFLLRDPVVGALASSRIAPWITVGGRVEAIWPFVGQGRSTKYPTVESRFAEREAPALNEQPRFTRYQGLLELDPPASTTQALNQGGRYRFAYSIFADQELDRFTFHRVDLEAHHRFAIFGPHRRLTLHAWIATTDASKENEVPFFLQPTLGGKGQLDSVSEDLIGSDGSRGTLRGFRDFRFRDRNLLLLQAEYRVPVWGPLDATVFVDAGKVASRPAHLNLSGLKHNYGLSMSVMKGPSTVARTEFAFGGGEGTRLSISFGFDADLLP